MSKYITKKRMKEAGIAGHVNIPYGTEVEEVDGLIIYKGAAVCAITSRNAHLHFAKNDDGKGLERGALTLAITFRLEKRDAGDQGRPDRSEGVTAMDNTKLVAELCDIIDRMNVILQAQAMELAQLHALHHEEEIAAVRRDYAQAIGEVST